MNADRQVQPSRQEAFLAAHPVFRLEDVATALKERSHSAAQSWVKYHLSTGRLKLVERGVYAAVPPGVDSRSFQPDPFLVASTIRRDAVFCYHAALQLLGVAHSEWNTVNVFTARRRRPLTASVWRIEFSPHPAPLRTRNSAKKGLEEVRYRGTSLQVTGPERTMVEGFHNPEKVGDLEELVISASGFAGLNLQVLQDLLEAYDRKILWAAVGWFLARYRRAFSVPGDFLRGLERHVPRSPQYLPRGRRGQGGVLVRSWNLILPESVVALGEADVG